MKRIIVIAIIAFFIAMAIGILMGLLRDSLKMGLIFGRALLSVLGTVGIVIIVQFALQKFFPELLAPLDEQKSTIDESSPSVNIEDEGALSDVKEKGTKVNVILDDPISTSHYMGAGSGLSQEASDYQEDEAHSRKLSAESFYHQDPRDLAAAVRTTLSRDES